MLTRLLPPVVALGLLLACPQRQLGTIVGAHPDTSFAAGSSVRLVVDTPQGLTELGLDGSSSRALFGSQYFLVDLSDDGLVWALSDDDTNLFLSTGGSAPRTVPQLADRLGGGALSRSGDSFAAYRHADFSKPQFLWTDDDALYVIDTSTLAVRVVPKGSTEMVTRLVRDGSNPDVVWLRMFDHTHQQVVLSSGVRQVLPQSTKLRVPPQNNLPSTCPASGLRIELAGYEGDEGIDLVDAAGVKRRLVKVIGRVRSGHDHMDTITRAFFVDDCRYLIYRFHREVWVAEVATGDTGPLIIGDGAFVRPISPAATAGPPPSPGSPIQSAP